MLHSGPAESLAEQQGHVVRELARLSGTDFTPEELEAAYRYQRDLAEMTIAGAGWPAIEAHVRAARGERWAAHVDLPEHAEDAGLAYYRRCPHDSRDALRALEVPVLALFGEKDFVVPPELKRPSARTPPGRGRQRGLARRRLPRGEPRPLPGRRRGEAKPYRWMRRPPGYFETLLDWIAERVR